MGATSRSHDLPMMWIIYWQRRIACQCLFRFGIGYVFLQKQCCYGYSWRYWIALSFPFSMFGAIRCHVTFKCAVDDRTYRERLKSATFSSGVETV
ncbi:hypothetical protein VTO73DRAFT_8612 [Trametes versicolor]